MKLPDPNNAAFRAALLILYICISTTQALGLTTQALEPTGDQPVVITPNGRQIRPYEESNALLISASAYSNGWPQLPNTKIELDRIGNELRKHGFRVIRAHDPSGTELRSLLDDFRATYGFKKTSRFLIMFSGHGFTNPSTGVGYLVPIDAPLPSQDGRKFFLGALSIRSLDVLARELEVRHALFIFDSCFSGAIFATRAVPDVATYNASERWRFFSDRAEKPLRQFIAAGAADETLPAESEFAKLLVQALQGSAQTATDGYLTSKEIGLWLEQNVPRFVTKQNPHSDTIRDADLSQGDMIFQVARTPWDVNAQRTLPLDPARSSQTEPTIDRQSSLIAPSSRAPLPNQAPTLSEGPSQYSLITPSPIITPPSQTIPFVPSGSKVEKVTFAADAFFDYEKAALRPEGSAKLRDLAEKTHDINLEVIIAVGHTDSSEGSDDYAQRLSVRRADSVKAYLVSLGIEKNRVYTEGKGKKLPTADNKTAEGRAKNRRVEIEAVGSREIQQR